MLLARCYDVQEGCWAWEGLGSSQQGSGAGMGAQHRVVLLCLGAVCSLLMLRWMGCVGQGRPLPAGLSCGECRSCTGEKWDKPSWMEFGTDDEAAELADALEEGWVCVQWWDSDTTLGVAVCR